MAFLTLFRIATGDNWNGIMKDTIREECDDSPDCLQNCCIPSLLASLFFVVFVLVAQFVLVNVVVAVLMKHLEESHKQVSVKMLVTLNTLYQSCYINRSSLKICSSCNVSDFVFSKSKKKFFLYWEEI